ncbi:guanylate kinase [bacterium]|nr:guanylate kinase [bacterium]
MSGSPRTAGSEASARSSGRRCSPLFPDEPRRGRLIVVSGPSGAGKSSVVEGLANRLPFRFSVSMTTRAARPGEVDGEDYHFVDDDRFDQAVAAGELAEWAPFSGRRYGTPRSEIESALSAGEDMILDIEIIGSRFVKKSYPDAVMVYVEPPSLDALEVRLRERGDTSDEDIAQRLSVAREHIAEAHAGLFDYFVVNDDLNRAVEQVVGILSSSRPPGFSS